MCERHFVFLLARNAQSSNAQRAFRWRQQRAETHSYAHRSNEQHMCERPIIRRIRKALWTLCVCLCVYGTLCLFLLVRIPRYKYILVDVRGGVIGVFGVL